MSQPTMTPAERIRELSAINSDVPALLSSAGKAINALTNRPLNSDEASNGTIANSSVAAHKEAFVENAKAYFVHVQAITARLRRQAYALEEAGIIAAEAPALSTSGEATQRTGPAQVPVRRAGMGNAAMPQRQPADDGDRVTNGGLGSLDVGLLNSRGNSVGLEKEAELMAEAKGLLKDMRDKSSKLGE